MKMNNAYITIGEVQYYTTKEVVAYILNNNGFDVTFKPESISGRFRKGYYTVKINHNFKCFVDKLKASKKVKKELDKLEVI